ncbi:MAG: C-terminal binding protein [Paenibacillaceae bacterium]|nr:C-terminal binding protein [Paenibacillaceae bacterium]
METAPQAAERTVAVTDFTFPDLERERHILEPLGFRFVTGQCRRADEVLALCRHADAILTQYAPIDAAVIAGLERCRIIVRYGIGVDSVDLEAAARRGIPVVNVPDYGIQEVADHTFTLLLSVVRKIPAIVRQVREGIWENAPCAPVIGLRDKVLGLAGFGNIARAVAVRAQAFNMRVIACDPYVQAADFAACGVRGVTREQLLGESDVISVHLPLNEGTRHLFNEQTLAGMKRSAYLINTSRGGVIDTEALAAALRQGHIAGAALDVLEEEPHGPGNPLLQLDNCLVTSHCAWYSEDSIVRLQQYAAMEICRLFSGQQPKHIVNRV